MYDEDRVHALNLYGDIFDEIGNDTAVLQLLVSPTRQAVNLARAYDAKDRGGQTENRAAYLGVIDELRRQAESLLPAAPAKVDDDQLSLFSEADRPENVFESFGFDFPDEPDAEDAKEEPPEELPEELPDGLSRFPDEDRAEDVVLPAPAPVIPSPEPQEKTPDQELDDFADSVAAFLAGFGMTEEEAPKAGKPAAPAEAKAAEETRAAAKEEVKAEVKTEAAPDGWTEVKTEAGASAPAPVPETPHPVQKEIVWQVPAKSDAPAEPVTPNVPEMKERVPIVWLLVLFIIAAIPVGLVGIALLLTLALASLGLAAAALSVGFYGFVTAFTAFNVFADILLVFGLSLALVALGLLLFWVFVWLLGGVIPAFVRGLIHFAEKHCFKEVSL